MVRPAPRHAFSCADPLRVRRRADRADVLSFSRPQRHPHCRSIHGGGTPLLEANRVGCDVIGYDINPMAYWIVRQEIEHLDLLAYRDATEKVGDWLAREVGQLYQTTCLKCGRDDASVKYFLWVKQIACPHCHNSIDLFPGYLLAENRRHPKNVIICQGCGELNEVDDRAHPGACGACRIPLAAVGPASRNRVACPQCGKTVTYPNPSSGPPRHRLFAIEYHCPGCKPQHRGRFFKKPGRDDLDRYAQAEGKLRRMRTEYVPTTRSRMAMRRIVSTAGATVTTARCLMRGSFSVSS